MWLSNWWATVPTWAKPVVLAFALTVGWGILQAIPRIVKATIKVWKWMQTRSDGKVLRIMENATRNAKLSHPGKNLALLPFAIEELAGDVKRSVKSAHKSLRRLEDNGKVHEVQHGKWCLENRTQREITDERWNRGRMRGRF